MSEETKERLAEGPSCSIDLCGCGVLHVSFGPITLRLQVDVVQSIFRTLGQALNRLEVDPRFRAEGDPSARDQSLS